MSGVDQNPMEESEQVDDLPAPGEVIDGKYEVEEVLGSGGMGAVLAARHVQLGKRVAIKLLHRALVSDEITVARFLREARATVELKSEHAAQVFDVGILEDGRPYMIMEHLRGKDLEALLEEQGALALADAVDYVLQGSAGLAEAHRHGLVHRDLKPGNLFLTRAVDGGPLIKVLDFGITKRVNKACREEQKLTTTGMALGTPLFMSPEQIRDTKNVDHRSDIWALGAVLHELLTGSPPFAADTIAALSAMIAADDPPPLRSLQPDLPAGLEVVVERCLEKRPQDRYQNVAEFAQALEEFAPARAQPLVDRIERIAVASSAPEALTENWRAHDDLADTMVSTQPDGQAEKLTGATEPPEDSSTRSTLPASQPLGQTDGAWHGDRPRSSSSPAVLLGIAVVGSVIAVVLWRPWSHSSQDEPDVETTSTVSPNSAQPAATTSPRSATTSARPIPSSAAGPSVAGSATTSTTVPSASAAAPPASVRARVGRPKPEPSAVPPAPEPTYNLLDERK